jgi:WD40 repeat protein/uncharacterized caspase-like protein
VRIVESSFVSRMIVFVWTAVGALFPANVIANDRILPTEIISSTGHSSSITSVVLSRSGRNVISTAGTDQIVKLWDVESGRLLRVFQADASVTAIAFSTNGQSVIAATSEKILFWDAETSHLLGTIQLPKARSINSVTFSFDDRYIAAGQDDGITNIWDTKRQRLIRTISTKSDRFNNRDAVREVAFSPDTQQIAAVFSERIEISSVETGRLLRTFDTGPAGFPFRIKQPQFSADGRLLAYHDPKNRIQIWDTGTGQLVRAIGFSNQKFRSMALSPDGTQVASMRFDEGLIDIWDVQSGRLIKTFEGRGTVAFSQDGQRLFSCCREVTTWELETGRELARRTLRYLAVSSWKGVRTVAASFDGQIVVSQNTSSIFIWDATTGRLKNVIKAPTWSFALSPDARQIAFGKDDGKTIEIMETSTGRIIQSFPGNPPLVFSHDGTKLLFDLDKKVQIREMSTGKIILTIPDVNNSVVLALAISPDGSQLAIGSTEDVRLWNTVTGRFVRKLVAAPSGIQTNSITYTTDGRNIVTNTGIWDVGTGRLSKQNADERISALSLLPNTKFLLSGTASGKLSILSFPNLTSVKSFDAHTSAVQSISARRDELIAVSGGFDNTLKYWDLRTRALLATSVVSGSEWLTITAEGFFDASEKGSDLLGIVRGFEVLSIDQVYQSLYRPDLVREKLAGDPQGLVREAAVRLDLATVLASGNAPKVSLVAPREGAQIGPEHVTGEVEITDSGGGIGRVEWRVNGVTVGVESPAPAAGLPLRITRELTLDEGINDIEVVAYNSANLIASIPARVNVAGPMPGTRLPGRLFVLAIGLNDYADPRFELAYAVPDAKALGRALAETGKGLYDGQPHVTLLNDGEVSPGNLFQIFTKLADEMRPTDTFVFFLAGHGKTVEGRYYFLPQDFRLDGEPTKANIERAVLTQGIAQEQWQRWFAFIPTRRSVMLFDTCESGTLTGERRETQALERGAGSDRLAQATGRTILTASSGDTDAWEGYRGHGLFTYNLLEALERGDGDDNGTIEVTELAAYVHAQVTTLSEKVFKRRQTPQVRITSNYAFARAARVLPATASDIVIPQRPTHQTTNSSELLVVPMLGARQVRRLDPNTPVTMVNSEGGWALVARDSRPLGYIANRDLIPIR